VSKRYRLYRSRLPGVPQFGASGSISVGVRLTDEPALNGRRTQPGSGRPYPTSREPVVELILWAPSGGMLPGGVVRLPPAVAEQLVTAITTAATAAAAGDIDS
jgi:hypothetical protein